MKNLETIPFKQDGLNTSKVQFNNGVKLNLARENLGSFSGMDLIYNEQMKNEILNYTTIAYGNPFGPEISMAVISIYFGINLSQAADGFTITNVMTLLCKTFSETRKTLEFLCKKKLMTTNNKNDKQIVTQYKFTFMGENYAKSLAAALDDMKNRIGKEFCIRFNKEFTGDTVARNPFELESKLRSLYQESMKAVMSDPNLLTMFNLGCQLELLSPLEDFKLQVRRYTKKAENELTAEGANAAADYLKKKYGIIDTSKVRINKFTYMHLNYVTLIPPEVLKILTKFRLKKLSTHELVYRLLTKLRKKQPRFIVKTKLQEIEENAKIVREILHESPDYLDFIQTNPKYKERYEAYKVLSDLELMFVQLNEESAYVNRALKAIWKRNLRKGMMLDNISDEEIIDYMIKRETRDSVFKQKTKALNNKIKEYKKKNGKGRLPVAVKIEIDKIEAEINKLTSEYHKEKEKEAYYVEKALNYTEDSPEKEEYIKQLMRKESIKRNLLKKNGKPLHRFGKKK